MTEEICDLCGGPATPGGMPDEDIDTICPPCEDELQATQEFQYPPGNPRRTPPHGNTTR